MVTSPALFIEQHMESVGLSFETLGDKLGVSRTTVWRWAKEPWRLDPPKMAMIARALDLDSPQDLFRRPSRPSIDGILGNADQNTYDAVLDLARRLSLKTE